MKALLAHDSEFFTNDARSRVIPLPHDAPLYCQALLDVLTPYLPLYQVVLSARANTIIKRQGWTILHDLLEQTPGTLALVKGLGPTSTKEIITEVMKTYHVPLPSWEAFLTSHVQYGQYPQWRRTLKGDAHV